MTLIDHYRHVYGVYSDKIKEAIKFIDDQLGLVFDELKQQGLYEETYFVICSDHGQVDIQKSINVNQDFIQKGWITLDEAGNVTDWKVFCHSGAASAQVYVKDHDQALKEEVYSYLVDNKERFCIEEVFTTKEARERFHLDGAFDFVIEAKEGSSFNYRLDDPFEKAFNNEDYRTSVGTHGHIPTRGSQPALILCGPDIPKGKEVTYARNIDIAPTCAHILGFDMPGCDGSIIKEVF